DTQGQSHQVTICYDKGGWYMDHFDSRHYSTSYPHLLFEVEKDIRAFCAAGSKTSRQSSRLTSPKEGNQELGGQQLR
ncbi:MAG: hypothetical protein ACYTG0_39945, partial [Planctomycetota bacterium]